MANKNKKKSGFNQQDMFDAKIFFSKYIKRYGIILLIAIVPIALINIFLLKGLSSTVIIVVDLALLLFACFIGLVAFTKIEEKRENNPKPKKHDPFAD